MPSIHCNCITALDELDHRGPKEYGNLRVPFFYFFEFLSSLPSCQYLERKVGDRVLPNVFRLGGCLVDPASTNPCKKPEQRVGCRNRVVRVLIKSFRLYSVTISYTSHPPPPPTHSSRSTLLKCKNGNNLSCQISPEKRQSPY